MYTQQNFTRLKQTTIGFFLSAPLKQFYKRSFYVGNALSLFVYASIRLMLHDFPFEILEETFFIVRIALAGWCMAALCICSFTAIMFITDNSRTIIRMGLQRTTTFYNLFVKTIKAIPGEKFLTRKQTVIESINI